MKDDLILIFAAALKSLVVNDVTPQVTLSDNPAHGEYSTNVAMQISKVLKKPPMDIALEVVAIVNDLKGKIKADTLNHNTDPSDQNIAGSAGINHVLRDIDRVEVVAPGFINVHVSEARLSTSVSSVLNNEEAYGTAPTASTGKLYMVEYAHPNTHKAFHIGHMRNIATGESLVRILEAAGHQVIRANYQGDVGMHIAKCLYGILQIKSSKFKVQSWQEVSDWPVHKRVQYLGDRYAAGSKAYEEDQEAKKVIHDYNYLVYAAAARFAAERGLPAITTDYLGFVKGRKADVDTVFEVWKTTRQWSLEYFDHIYRRVGTHYDRFYFESECLGGVDRAKDAVKSGILKISDGAIIFEGKPHGLDTRVFVNSLGLPTYEGKELALAAMEFTEHGKLDKLIHVVGPEQASFFKVTFKAEELLNPDMYKGRQHHLIYGWVRLKKGKMSSRLGNVILGEWLLDEAKKEVYKILSQSIKKYTKSQQSDIAEKAAVAAVKYSFLKVGLTTDIAFDFSESVTLEGDSGPYLQYAYARCRSVVRRANISQKSEVKSQKSEVSKQKSEVKSQNYVLSSFMSDSDTGYSLNPEERAVARLILHFPDVVRTAAQTYNPSGLCSYLFNLAQAYNVFYAKHSILNINSKLKTQSSKLQLKGQNHDDEAIGTQISNSELVAWRVGITDATARVLKKGLYLLGIEALEQM